MADRNEQILEGEVAGKVFVNLVGSSRKASFRVKSVREGQDAGGRFFERTGYFDVVAWSDAKAAFQGAQSLREGDRVLVEGAADIESWTDKSTGERKVKQVLRAESVTAAAGSRPAPAKSPPRRSPPKQNNDYEPIDEDDIPF